MSTYLLYCLAGPSFAPRCSLGVHIFRWEVPTLAVGTPHRGRGSPLCGSTRQWWACSALVWLDTLAVGSLHLRVARHVGGGFAPPSCGSTRWRWARSHLVWLDTLAVGSSAVVCLACQRWARLWRSTLAVVTPPSRGVTRRWWSCSAFV